ncbi:hypothetical protein M2280_005961 [Prescottella agglutinans]|uniref:Transposase n=1 Tax=Prescottella agglutinans TaxID=1644129 RepID=A0ABT6MK77_9NOCA|nr:hypothetical protein [Prescottella agglutinans]
MFDPPDYRGRNVVDRRFCHLKQWRGLATRYVKLAFVYRAAVVLNAVIGGLGICQTCPNRIAEGTGALTLCRGNATVDADRLACQFRSGRGTQEHC